MNKEKIGTMKFKKKKDQFQIDSKESIFHTIKMIYESAGII